MIDARPRLALLDASEGATHTRRNFRRELAADLMELDVVSGALPASIDVDGVVITGSKASVYADEPWIDPLLAWVADVVDRGLPVLGVCFGHQVLAAALGGRVEGMGEYEIGYRTIRRTGESRLLAGVPNEFVAFTTHQDRVVELPPEAMPIAENEFGNHGFERGNAFTVQFHPEYDRATAREVATGKPLDEAKMSRVLAGITTEHYAQACEVKRLFDTFITIVEERRVAQPTGD